VQRGANVNGHSATEIACQSTSAVSHPLEVTAAAVFDCLRVDSDRTGRSSSQNADTRSARLGQSEQ
jgi:hypothetical protein